jgi:uncharacterized protein (TIGR02284 family)
MASNMGTPRTSRDAEKERPMTEGDLGESAVRPGDLNDDVERVPTTPRVAGDEPIEPTPPRIARPALDKLNECLRGELSAVETYDLALHKVKDAELSSALRQIRDNHDRRVTELRDILRASGGEPSQSSGAWGAFAKLVQRSADLFGDRAAMSTLEEGEDHGLKMYSEDLDLCDAQTRELIMTRLLPEQRKTHDLCRSLERFTRAA